MYIPLNAEKLLHNKWTFWSPQTQAGCPCCIMGQTRKTLWVTFISVIINNSDLIVYTFSLLPVRKLRRRPCKIFLLCRLQHHFLALPAKIMQKSERKKEVQPLATVFIYISPTFLMGVSPFFFCAAISACRGFKEG